MLTAGQETPRGCQPRQKRGVAIVLTGYVVTAWKVGGEQWKSWVSKYSKLLLEEVTRRSTVFISYHAMHQHLLQVKLKKISSLMTYSKFRIR